MTNANKGYNLKESVRTLITLGVGLIPLLGLLATTHYYAFNIGTETYQGALEKARLIAETKDLLAQEEITKTIKKNSSETFYGGIYVLCNDVRLEEADIIVSVAEPGKSEIVRKSMKAGSSIGISYKNKSYNLILKSIKNFENIVVSIAKMD